MEDNKIIILFAQGNKDVEEQRLCSLKNAELFDDKKPFLFLVDAIIYAFSAQKFADPFYFSSWELN